MAVQLGKRIVQQGMRSVRTEEIIALSQEARVKGLYVIGTPGTGKTNLIKNIALQDMAAGEGVCVLDPHGDLVDELLAQVPPWREQDVILFAPGDPEQMKRPLGLNLFECDRDDEKQRNRVTSTVIDTLYKLFFYSWGPRMEDLLRHSILTLMETPGTTLLDMLLLLTVEAHRERLLDPVRDSLVMHFWEEQFAKYTTHQQVEVTGSSLNKIGRFLVNPIIRRVVCQERSAFSITDVVEGSKILLVNLSKGDLGEDNSALLGSVLVNLLLIAALQRRSIPPQERKPFHIIADEYQSFATSSFPTLQSESRKYGFDVIVAHQFRDQLDELNRGSTLNVSNFVMLRVSGKDSFELASQFDNTPPPAETTMEPVYMPYDQDLTLFTQVEEGYGGARLYEPREQPRRAYSDVQAEKANQLSTLPEHVALSRLIVGRSLQEFLMETLPPMGQVDLALAERIRRRSVELGRPASEVDAEIRDNLGDEDLTIPLIENTA